MIVRLAPFRAGAWLLFALWACLSLPASAAPADEVVLNSGAVYKGKVTAQNADEVTIEVTRGATKIPVKLARITVKEVRVGDDASGKAPASAKAKGEDEDATPEEVEKEIEAAGANHPDWWDGTPMNLPKSVDLTWNTANLGEKTGLEDYLKRNIRPRSGNWRLGVKILHEALEVNKDDPARYRRTCETLGEMYLSMTDDVPHAAYFYRRCIDEKTIDRLAACYWKMGCDKMAGGLLAPVKVDATPTCGVIRMWGNLAQPRKAIDLAEETAKAGNKAQAYLAAGDALRTAGELDKSQEYYAKVIAADPKDARVKALAQANLDAVKLIQSLDPTKLGDGRYTGTVTCGPKGGVTIDLILRRGKITTARVSEIKEEAPLTAPLEVAQQILMKQGVRGVSTITGATSSSSAILDAAVAALSKSAAVAPAGPAPGPGPAAGGDKYKDGVYTGSARGHKSQIAVQVTVKGGKITDVRVTNQKDDKRWWDRAVTLVPKIVQNQGTDGVMPVTRATRSSNGILNAANDALSKALK